MPVPLIRTNYDGLENVRDSKVIGDRVVHHKDQNDPYKIMPDNKGKNRIRKNQLISQERVKRMMNLTTTSKTATIGDGLWGYTFTGKNEYEGSTNTALKWPYNNVEGAKCINIFGKKNKQLSLKNTAEFKEMDEVEKAGHEIMALPTHTPLNQVRENINYEPRELKKVADADKIDVVSDVIPLGMKNASLEKQKAYKKKQESYQKNNFKPKLLESGQNVSQDDKDRPKVVLEIKIDGRVAGELVCELRADIVPQTVKNFRALCNHERGFGYRNCKIHRVIPSFMIQAGDFTRGDGTGGYSIFGPRFKDENFTLKHDEPYVLSMANSGPNTNGGQFFITTKATPWLDGKHVVFGKVISGKTLIHQIEKNGSQSGHTRVPMYISGSGDVDEMTEEQRAAHNKALEEKKTELLRRKRLRDGGNLPREGEKFGNDKKGKYVKDENVFEVEDKNKKADPSKTTTDTVSDPYSGMSDREKRNMKEILRLTKPGSKYLNLNPWRVLNLDHLATEPEVKKAFKKLSICVHPDRNQNHKEAAQKAFDALKKANEILNDPKRKEEALNVLSEAKERVNRRLIKETEQARKEAKLTRREVKVELAKKEVFDAEVQKETTKLFADMDLAHQERVQREQVRKAQELQLENEQAEFAKMCKEYNQNFNESRQQRVDAWYKFERKVSGRKQAKKKKYKIGTFKPPRPKMQSSGMEAEFMKLANSATDKSSYAGQSGSSFKQFFH